MKKASEGAACLCSLFLPGMRFMEAGCVFPAPVAPSISVLALEANAPVFPGLTPLP